MKFLGKKELLEIVPYSMSHIYRLERQSRFPKRVKIGTGRGGRVAWVESEVQSWMASTVQSRPSEIR